MVGKNADKTLWTVEQWKQHATTVLQKESFSHIPAVDKATRAAFEQVLKSPDDASPEYMQNLAKHMAASIMASVIDKHAP